MSIQSWTLARTERENPQFTVCLLHRSRKRLPRPTWSPFLTPAMSYPGVNKLFTSPVRPDGSEKWVDYADSFWHVDCVLDSGPKVFAERYQSFCKHHGYDYQPARPEKLYAQAKELVPTVPKDPVYKEMIRDSIAQLNLMSKHVEELRRKMDELASSLPEYQTVRSMYGVGPSLGPQIMAEIGDISRFNRREALTAYAGVDPGKTIPVRSFTKVVTHRNAALHAFGNHCSRSWRRCSSSVPAMTIRSAGSCSRRKPRGNHISYI